MPRQSESVRVGSNAATPFVCARILGRGARAGAALYGFMDSKSFQTLNEIFLQAVENSSRKDLFLSKSEGQYRGISAREVSSTVSSLARAFNAMGVYAGSRVALLSENRLEWALTDYAILGLGARHGSALFHAAGRGCEFILRDSGAQRELLFPRRDQLKRFWPCGPACRS